MNDNHRHKPRLVLLHGGGDDWRAFCQRIGWQQLSEPALPDDYEDRLAMRIFGKADFGRAEPRARRWGWLAAAAIIALAGIGAALFARHERNTPPTADTVPTPVPEVVHSPPPEKNVERPPRPKASSIIRGVRHTRVVHEAPEEREELEVIESPRTMRDPISPDGEPDASAFHSPWLTPLVSDNDAWRGSSPERAAVRAPQWRHLVAAAPAQGGRAMALVDVVQAGRRLSEPL